MSHATDGQQNALEAPENGCPECWAYTRETYALFRGNGWPRKLQDEIVQQAILGFTCGHHAGEAS